MSLNDSGFEVVENFVSLDMATSIINETDSELLKNRGGGSQVGWARFLCPRGIQMVGKKNVPTLR